MADGRTKTTVETECGFARALTILTKGKGTSMNTHRMLVIGLATLLASSLMAQDIKTEEAPVAPSKTTFTPARNQDIPGVDYTPLAVPSTKKGGAREAVYNVGDTPPLLSNMYWANQGSCIANTNPDGSITVFHPGAAGVAFNWCVLAQVLPTPPYSIIMGIRGHIFERAASLGIHLYDVYTGKFIVYSSPGASDSGAVSMAAWKMNNFNTYAGSFYYTYNNPLVTGGILPTYYRIRDNGTTRTFAVSHDKTVWLTISAVPSNDFITPNFYGYTLRGSGNGVASMMTIYHENITNP